MAVLLLFMAIFAGIFACAFGLAGLLGLMDFELPPERRPRVLLLCDTLFAGGILATLHDIYRNWPKRPTERRMIYVGIAFALLVVGLFTLFARVA